MQIFILFSSAYANEKDNALLPTARLHLLQTKNTIINYQNIHDLTKLATALKYEPDSWYLKNLLEKDNSEGPGKTVSRTIDAIFKRVREILDMRPKMKKVQINLYSNTQDLQEVYQQRFSKKKHIRAWYVFKENTIYASVDDLHEGIMAHEMAHAIIDHYFAVKPPAATAEILARYVDKHLTR